jgi:hypothetical protein
MNSRVSSDLAAGNAALAEESTLAAHYGFRSVPFAATSLPGWSDALPDARQLSGEIAAALQGNRAIALVEVAGNADTETLIGGVAAALERHSLARVAAESGESFDGLLLRCCRILGIDVPTAECSNLDRFLLNDLLKKGRRSQATLLIVEHAERVAPHSLRKLHMLTELGMRRFLQILLVSAPSFGKLLENPELVLLRDALGTIYRLAGTDAPRVNRFIEAQLQAAGSPRVDLFEAAAVARISDHARGDLEVVVRLCRQALVIARLQGLSTVGIETVEHAALVVILQPSFGAPAGADDARASRSKLPSSTANDQRVDRPSSRLPAGFVASQRTSGQERPSTHPGASVAARAPLQSALLPVTPPPNAGNDRRPIALAGVALVAILAGASWAAYHQVEAVLARSHARGPAHLAYANAALGLAEPSQQVRTEAPPHQPVPATVVSATESDLARASMARAVVNLEPAAAAGPEQPPATSHEKADPAAVSILNDEPFFPAGPTNPAPQEAMLIAAFPAGAEATLSAAAAIEASHAVEPERAQSVVRDEQPRSNAAHVSSSPPAPVFEAPAAHAPITRADGTASSEPRSLAAAPAANAARAAADRKVHSASSVQPDGLEEIASIPTADRPPSYKELQANGVEVTSLTPLAVDPVTTVSTPSIEGSNLPPPSLLTFAHSSAETNEVGVSIVAHPGNFDVPSGAIWPRDAAVPPSAAELGAEPGRGPSDRPPPQTAAQSERATYNFTRHSDPGLPETSATPPAHQETAPAAGQAEISAPIVPSTSSLPSVRSAIDRPLYATGTSMSPPASPTVEVSSRVAPEPPRVSQSALSPPGASTPPARTWVSRPASPGSVDATAGDASSTPTGAQALMLARGEAHLKSGDFAAARVFFQRAGKNQFAALGLAKTYDPLYFSESGIVGARGDRKLAMKWYHEAAESAPEAAERLRRLEAAPE